MKGQHPQDSSFQQCRLDTSEDAFSPHNISSKNPLSMKQGDYCYYSAQVIQEEPDDSATISPPMEYEKWRAKRMRRIEEFSRLVESSSAKGGAKTQSIDDAMFSNRKREQENQRYALSSQKESPEEYGREEIVENRKPSHLIQMTDPDSQLELMNPQPFLVAHPSYPPSSQYADFRSQHLVVSHSRNASHQQPHHHHAASLEKNYNQPLQMKSPPQHCPPSDIMQPPFASSNAITFKPTTTHYQPQAYISQQHYFTSGQASDLSLSKSPKNQLEISAMEQNQCRVIPSSTMRLSQQSKQRTNSFHRSSKHSQLQNSQPEEEISDFEGSVHNQIDHFEVGYTDLEPTVKSKLDCVKLGTELFEPQHLQEFSAGGGVVNSGHFEMSEGGSGGQEGSSTMMFSGLKNQTFRTTNFQSSNKQQYNTDLHFSQRIQEGNIDSPSRQFYDRLYQIQQNINRLQTTEEDLPSRQPALPDASSSEQSCSKAVKKLRFSNPHQAPKPLRLLDQLDHNRFTPSEVRLIQGKEDEVHRLRAQVKQLKQNGKQILKEYNGVLKQLEDERAEHLQEVAQLKSQLSRKRSRSKEGPRGAQESQRLDELEKAVAQIMSSLVSSQFQITLNDKKEITSALNSIKEASDKENRPLSSCSNVERRHTSQKRMSQPVNNNNNKQEEVKRALMELNEQLLEEQRRKTLLQRAKDKKELKLGKMKGQIQELKQQLRCHM